MYEKTKTICALMIIAEICCEDEDEFKRRTRKIWMKEWYKKENEFANTKLLNELKVSQPDDFKNYMRMDDATFQDLLEKVKPIIIKKDTFMRDAISPETRLSITLRYLANGNSFEDLKFFYAVSPQSIGIIVIETCDAIVKVLKDYIKLPETSSDWKRVAEKFQQITGFPQCIGAVDGKHIHIRKPSKSGSFYFNYKKSFSTVLMAIVNADSEFLMVDVGTNGRISDGGVFSNTTFFRKFQNNELNIPDPEVMLPTGKELNYVLVGDDAFSLSENLMKPFTGNNLTTEQEIFNKTLSSARVKVENAFGILATRFRVLLTTIAVCPEKATKIALACCYLHNYLKKRKLVLYSNCPAVTTQSTTQTLLEMQPSQSRNSSKLAKDMRNNFCEVVNDLHNNIQ